MTLVYHSAKVRYCDEEKEFSKLPKDTWAVVVHGDIGGNVEISCVHTSNKHAFVSCGWWGSKKVVVYSRSHGEGKYPKLSKLLHKTHIQTAINLCEQLVKEYPNGVPYKEY